MCLKPFMNVMAFISNVLASNWERFRCLFLYPLKEKVRIYIHKCRYRGWKDVS